MSTQYAAEIADAGTDIADAGQPITFTRTTQVYAPATDASTPAITTASGFAIRVRPRYIDVTRFLEPGLAIVDHVTLLVAAAGMDFDPLPGDTFEWGAYTYSVKVVDPTGPDGSAIIWRIIGSR